ncbi:MAG TPA: family 20 glycosylhydrolase [Pyrinomonadaceae bacterium]|nr:family 20 glycosylhydrolase [Pyrinomonadaceae bacterium]
MVLLLLVCLASSAIAKQGQTRTIKRPQPWRAVHLLNYETDAALETLGRDLEGLAKQGINVIILEVDYNFAFKSHPELRRGANPITFAGARRFAALCKRLNIRLIPEFQSVGHQSWKQETFPLLTVYPKFDLTPGAFPNNEGIYCREWDVLNPEVWRVVFQLMDEIIDAFRADALHVGMDEVFLLGSEKSPSTNGQDPATLFAKAVKQIYTHLVRKRGVEMLMWGDRLIDGKKYDLGEWEASTNGTAAAIDLIPKDIIICPWHYELRADGYPSIPMFIEKGFRVLPAGWKNLDAMKALIEFSRTHTGPKLLGNMFTTWGVKKEELLTFPPLVEGLKLLQQPPQPPRELQFEIKHRVNAHGDEFNGLAKSSDGQRLFTATEKGDIIVWNIAANRVERTLQNPSPAHLVASLSNPHEIVVAGSSHEEPLRPFIRKWNVETGAFTDLPGIDPSSAPIAIATETAAKLIAVATDEQRVVVWDAETNKQLAAWKLATLPISVALIGRTVYVATVDANLRSPYDEPKNGAIIKLKVDNPNRGPTDFLRIAGRTWRDLDVSPDRRLLSATYQAYGEGSRVVAIDPVSKKELGKFAGSLPAWIDNSKLMLFEWLDPSEIVQVSLNAPPKSIYKFGRMEADTPGRAFDTTGQASNADGSKAWATYRKGSALLEFDRATNKIKTLLGGPSGAYALSVNESAGEVLTGGADGYVRLWKLEDLSLIKEYNVAKTGYFVSNAHLVPGSRIAIVGVRLARKPTPNRPLEPTEVFRLDLETGEQKKLFDEHSWRSQLAVVGNEIVYAEGDSVRLTRIAGDGTSRELKMNGPIVTTAVSANNRWLAVVDSTAQITVVDLTTLQRKAIEAKGKPNPPIVITNDGRYIYQIGHEGALTRWDVNTGAMTNSVLARIREMHSSVDFMTLANDDQWLVTAGNHGDVGIFDRTTGRLVCYTQTAASAFYVERVWTNGTRILLTTDTGVMYDGILK